MNASKRGGNGQHKFYLANECQGGHDPQSELDKTERHV